MLFSILFTALATKFLSLPNCLPPSVAKASKFSFTNIAAAAKPAIAAIIKVTGLNSAPIAPDITPNAVINPLIARATGPIAASNPANIIIPCFAPSERLLNPSTNLVRNALTRSTTPCMSKVSFISSPICAKLKLKFALKFSKLLLSPPVAVGSFCSCSVTPATNCSALMPNLCNSSLDAVPNAFFKAVLI